MTFYVATRKGEVGHLLTHGHASEKEAASHCARMDTPEDWEVVEWVAEPQGSAQRLGQRWIKVEIDNEEDRHNTIRIPARMFDGRVAMYYNVQEIVANGGLYMNEDLSDWVPLHRIKRIWLA